MSAQFGNRSPLPPNAELAAMLRDGATLADLGKRYGVTPATIRGHLTSAGWDSDGQPHRPTPKPLPMLVQEDQPWAEYALCAQADPEAWHPKKGVPSPKAKATCALCPVRQPCLEYALRTDQRWGIWGGLSERERRGLKPGRRDPGRPDWTAIREWAREQGLTVREVGPLSPKLVEAYNAAHPEAS